MFTGSIALDALGRFCSGAPVALLTANLNGRAAGNVLSSVAGRALAIGTGTGLRHPLVALLTKLRITQIKVRTGGGQFNERTALF